MAVTSGFFNSLNGDRKYSANQFSAIFDNLITDGVFANVGTAFEVMVSTENTVTVGVGRAWFNSIWVYNDTLYPMTVQDPEVILNRIDAIVIEINHNEAIRTGSIRWVYGSPSSSPSRPTLTNTDEVHQYPLAYVLRKAGRSSVIQADITNMIGTSACPYVTGILSTQNIDKIVAQWESMFSVWFDGLQTSLTGDVAANLANQILDLQSRFHTLAKEKTVYEELQDSSGAVIKDSNGGDILAKTVLSGGDKVIINYSSPQGGSAESFKVGDILTTVRADLDESWLLCNGATVNADEYSQLASVLPVNPNGDYAVKNVHQNSDQYFYPSKVIYVNGQYIIGIAINEYKNSCYLAYANNPAGNWTKITPSGMQGINDIAYGNGYYVAIRGYREDDYPYTQSTIVYYSASLNGPWSSVTISNFEANRIAFLNGQFVMCGYNNMIHYASNPAGPWSTQKVNTAAEQFTYVGYCNGYYFVCSEGVTRYSSSLSGTWNTVPGLIEAKSVAYHDGYYVFPCLTEGIAYTTAPSRTPTMIPNQVDDVTVYPVYAIYDGAQFVIAATEYYTTGVYRFCILYSKTAFGPYSRVPISSEISTISIEGVNMTSDGDYYVVNARGSNIVYAFSLYKKNIKLPEIPGVDNSYSYIKVKE